MSNLSENWKLRIDPKVLKTSKKFPNHDIKKILEGINQLADDPFVGNIKKMKGEKHVWRKRVGEYRIFYEFIKDDKVILVFHIERRTSKTY